MATHSSQRRQWQPTPVLLPGKSHGRRSLVGCSPWGHQESDTTERLHFHFLLSCIREGNGNPFQCSCLGNPRDGGAWWAAIYGVAQSWTQLNPLQYSALDNSVYCMVHGVAKSWTQLGDFHFHYVPGPMLSLCSLFQHCNKCLQKERTRKRKEERGL